MYLKTNKIKATKFGVNEIPTLGAMINLFCGSSCIHQCQFNSFRIKFIYRN